MTQCFNILEMKLLKRVKPIAIQKCCIRGSTRSVFAGVIIFVIKYDGIDGSCQDFISFTRVTRLQIRL